MSKPLYWDDLHKITHPHTKHPPSKAQVIAALRTMGMVFRITPSGHPVSSEDAYDQWLGIHGSNDSSNSDETLQLQNVRLIRHASPS